MGVFALTGQVVTLNAQDISAWCKSATLTVDAAQLDTSDFASDGWVEMIGGLKSGQLALELMDDVSVGEIDSDIWSILGTVVAFTLKPTSAAISTSNPEYQGNVLVTGWTIGGAVGDLASKSLTFPLSGAITRDVTP